MKPEQNETQSPKATRTAFVNLTTLPDLMTEKMLAEFLGKKSISMWRMRRQNPPAIPYLRIANAVYYLKADVEAFLAGRRIT